MKLHPDDTPAAGSISTKKKARKQTSNPELPGMPALDGLGKAARRYVEAIQSVEAAVTEKGDAKDALIRAMKKRSKTTMQVDGYTFLRDRKGPVDNIKVHKPK